MRSIRFLYGGNMRKYVTENIAAIQFNDLISVSLDIKIFFKNNKKMLDKLYKSVL